MPPRKNKQKTPASRQYKSKQANPKPGPSKSKKQNKKSQSAVVQSLTSNRKRPSPTSRTPNAKKKKTEPKQRVSKKTVKQKVQDDEFKEKTVSSKALSKWKPIQKSSQDLVSNLLDQAIMHSLSHSSAVSYNDVQDHLNNLKDRISTKMRKVKAPAAKYVNYKKMDSHCKLLEEVLVQSSTQIDLMEDQAEQLDKAVETKQDELEELQGNIDTFDSSHANWKKKLHPLLREDYEEELDLPPLPEESLKIPLCEVDDDLNAQQSRLLHRLTDLQSSSAADELTEYVENVAAVASALTAR